MGNFAESLNLGKHVPLPVKIKGMLIVQVFPEISEGTYNVSFLKIWFLVSICNIPPHWSLSLSKKTSFIMKW